MRNPIFSISFLLVSLVVLTACQTNNRSFFGIARETPDEFAVTTHQPLVLPDNFDYLPTPRLGENNPHRQAAWAAAQRLVYGEALVAEMSSPIEEHAVSLLPQQEVDTNLRATLYQEAQEANHPDTLLGNALVNLIFWQDPPFSEVVVDATAEKERLEENRRQNLLINQGNVPVIDPR